MILFITSVFIFFTSYIFYHVKVINPVKNEQKKAKQEREEKNKIDKLFGDGAYDYPWQSAEDI